ncbi:MAG: PAS domain-containing protein, partial [Betaproteobacteria bacterium]|nr:PAS domain-containing protein [Betaproteobacteria bacterium]
MRTRAQALLRDILLLRLGATPADYELIAKAIRQSDEGQQHPPSVRTGLGIVLQHAQNVLTHQQELDRLVQEITAADVRNVSKSLVEAYNLAFERELKQANLYRFILLLASLGLVTYAAYSFLRLRGSALSLRRAAEVQAREIAQRKRSEQALRESEERLRTIADNVPVLIGYVDSTERYQFANKAYEDWFGMPASAHIGRTLRDIMGEAP